MSGTGRTIAMNPFISGSLLWFSFWCYHLIDQPIRITRTKTNLMDPVKSPIKTSILLPSIDEDLRKIETKQLSRFQINISEHVRHNLWVRIYDSFIQSNFHESYVKSNLTCPLMSSRWYWEFGFRSCGYFGLQINLSKVTWGHKRQKGQSWTLKNSKPFLIMNFAKIFLFVFSIRVRTPFK